jgi:GNAT superfamily N-acetyltransferase
MTVSTSMMGVVHARPATPEDVAEVLRLAALMFEAIGTPVDAQWTTAAAGHLLSRIGDDVAVFVVDSPDHEERLIAVAAGSIQRRLPVPGRPEGRAGFVQWVSTDDRYRRRGASRSVMSALMAWFEESGVEVVELHATPPGEPLYRSLGFDDPAGRNLRWLPRRESHARRTGR